jgi:hypothetical protein
LRAIQAVGPPRASSQIEALFARWTSACMLCSPCALPVPIAVVIVLWSTFTCVEPSSVTSWTSVAKAALDSRSTSATTT